MNAITENTAGFLAGLPAGVSLVAAAKHRRADEVLAAVAGGVRIIGENYLQEAQAIYPRVGRRVRWHFIGRLQKNKIAKIVSLFDLVETVDSLENAALVSRYAQAAGRVMPVLLAVNSAGEPRKSGVLPGEAVELAAAAACLPGLRLEGLMTMGPRVDEPGQLRPYFRLVRRLARDIEARRLPGVSMETLSMGMSDSWAVAVAEGATLVRIGTLLFGPRP